MSFRNEEKLRIATSKIFMLKNWINNNLGSELFPPRIVNSIYFDNDEYSMYHNSMEGVVPRKKIRLRCYNSNFVLGKNINKETKISSVEGRYKISEKILNPKQLMDFGFCDQNYGMCHAVLNVTYKRSYYKVKNIRLTLDENISYKKIINKEIGNLSTFDNYNIVELKFISNESINFVRNNFPFERSRFSKYCRGIEFINFNYCNEL